MLHPNKTVQKSSDLHNLFQSWFPYLEISVHYCQIPELGKEASKYIESSYKQETDQYELSQLQC